MSNARTLSFVIIYEELGIRNVSLFFVDVDPGRSWSAIYNNKIHRVVIALPRFSDPGLLRFEHDHANRSGQGKWDGSQTALDIGLI